MKKNEWETAVNVDFESYYDKELSVTKLGPYAYLNHPDVDIYMVSIFTDTWDWVGRPEKFNWKKVKDHLWLSHNAAFDKTAYQAVCKKKNLVEVEPPEWNCTANLAAYMKAPRALDKAVAALLNGDVSKSMRAQAKGKTEADLKALGLYDAMKEYALLDGQAGWSLGVEYGPEWPAWERELSLLTIECALGGIPFDADGVEKSIKKLNRAINKAKVELPWLNVDDDKAKPLSPKSLALACKAARIPAPASTDEEDEDYLIWEENYGKKYPWVKHMRTVRKSTILLKRLLAVRARFDAKGYVPYGIKYFGAHTGRWSGDAGLNVQNFPKDPYEGVDFRRLIKPPKGKSLVIADLAQIEARILLWFAKDKKMIQFIKDGYSVYEAHAREYMGWKGGTLKNENPKIYALAKARVLGLGYGCGPDRFWKLATLTYKLELSEQEAKDTVAQFRLTNKPIKDYWMRIKKAIQACWDKRIDANPDFVMQLPSGRELRYHSLHQKDGTWENYEGVKVPEFHASPTKDLKRTMKLYGGVICENVVQATARDVFGLALLRLRDAGYKILFHIHDEVVLEVKTPKNPTAAIKLQNDVSRLMGVTPEWLEGCPVGSEVKIVQEYFK